MKLKFWMLTPWDAAFAAVAGSGAAPSRIPMAATATALALRMPNLRFGVRRGLEFSDRGCRRGPADPDRLLETLERATAHPAELHPGQVVPDGRPHLGRDQDLTALGRLGHPGRDVGGAADDIVPGDDHVAQVGAHPKPQRPRLHGHELDAC